MMRTERTKQILGVDTSKSSVNTDTYLSINLDGKERLLPTDEINHIVNVGERFDFERQRSKFYRIIGTINPTATNALFNLNDRLLAENYTWSTFNYQNPTAPYAYRFLDKSYPLDNDIDDSNDLTYKQAINSSLLEVNGWFGYKNPDKSQAGLCSFFDMEPKRERFSFIPDTTPYHDPTGSPVKNWELTITYPSSMDKTHNMVVGGLRIVEATQAIISNRNVTAIGVPCLHNLRIGDMVVITNTSGYDGQHVVIRTGLDNGDLKDYYFVIDKPFVGDTSDNSRFKRMFGGVPSEYYFRKFKKIKTKVSPIIETDDYETYQCGFSENIYADSISQFVFNEDIDVSDLTDNLGRPLTDIYLTIIKTSSNSLFSNISSGIETPFYEKFNTGDTNKFLKNIPVINKIHNGVTLPFESYNPLESNVTINNNNYMTNNNHFYGDLVEYNINEVKETILAEVSHRFNTVNRELPLGQTQLDYVTAIGTPPTKKTTYLGPRQEGYFYKPHHRIQIKEFSNYVEVGDKYTEGIPDYAIDLGDGRFVWRDILDIGFNETNDIGLKYPFLNGAHYLYSNYCFNVRRQDPFNNWGLYYGKFPGDPVGERITQDFTINSAEDVC